MRFEFWVRRVRVCASEHAGTYHGDSDLQLERINASAPHECAHSWLSHLWYLCLVSPVGCDVVIRGQPRCTSTRRQGDATFRVRS